MAQNQADWYPLPSGNSQQDENQRRIWQSLYYLRDRNNNASPAAAGPTGMSGTVAYQNSFTMGAQSFGSLTFKNGLLVAVSQPTANNNATSMVTSSVTAATPSIPASNLSSQGTVIQATFANAPIVSALPAAGSPLAVVGNYVTLNGVQYIYTAPQSGSGPGYWSVSTANFITIRDVMANLGLYPAANYPVGSVFYATDWQVSYAVQIPTPSNSKTWIFYNGVYEAALASIPTLGLNDINFLFRASDYFHDWVWSGTSWSFFESSSGYFLVFQSSSFLPTDLKLHLCDGSTVPVSQSNATTTNEVLPTVSNQYIVQ